MHDQAAADPKLSRSLDALAALGGSAAIRSRDLSRTHRERLLAHGHLREVLKGWYVPVRATQPRDPARAWYDDFWAFCADYLHTRFGTDWCLAPEPSIAIHTGDWTVPAQLTVRTPRGGNKPLTLPHGSGLLDLRLKAPPPEQVETRALSLRIMDLESALLASPAASYREQPRHLHAALWLLDDVELLAARLLEGGHSKIAGRLVGALRRIGRPELADALAAAMRAGGVAVTASDPFPRRPFSTGRNPSPYLNRQSVRRRWDAMRQAVVAAWPVEPQRETAAADDPEVAEAVAAMSLIGMSVDPLTVDVPGAATAGPPPDPAAALAAGYLELRRTLAAGAGAADGGAARRFSREMRDWHRLLLTPSVAAGHLAADSAGELRRHARFRRASPHTPPRHEAMRDLLPVLFELLQAEADVRVGAVLGHWLLTLLAPFEHGNRLLALALSRHLLAEAGAARIAATAAAYRSALESAWIEDDPRALTRLLGGGGD